MIRYLYAPAYVLGLMAVTIGPLMIAPYTGKGPHGTYREPVQAAEKTDKAQDRVIEPIRVATVAYRLDPPVQKAAVSETQERTTLPWSCETIRGAVKNLTAEQVERLARIYRLTPQQRAEARRCLKERT